jgi:uncharacterized protein YjiS (DUF1127 family)
MTANRAIAPAFDLVTGFARQVLAAQSRRQTERLIGRFSSHQLADMGFERDWDGSIYRPAARD